MKKAALGITCSLALCVAGGAWAQAIYRWTDKQGVTHYTNDPASVPPDAKASITQGGELGELSHHNPTPKASPEPAPAPAAPPPPPLQEAPSAPPDNEPAQDELAWRTRFRGLLDQITRLEADVRQDQRSLDDAKSRPPMMQVDRNGRVRDDQSVAYFEARLKQSRQQLAQARNDLDDLEREASRLSIPREWRR